MTKVASKGMVKLRRSIIDSVSTGNTIVIGSRSQSNEPETPIYVRGVCNTSRLSRDPTKMPIIEAIAMVRNESMSIDPKTDLC